MQLWLWKTTERQRAEYETHVRLLQVECNSNMSRCEHWSRTWLLYVHDSETKKGAREAEKEREEGRGGRRPLQKERREGRKSHSLSADMRTQCTLCVQDRWISIGLAVTGCMLHRQHGRPRPCAPANLRHPHTPDALLLRARRGRPRLMPPPTRLQLLFACSPAHGHAHSGTHARTALPVVRACAVRTCSRGCACGVCGRPHELGCPCRCYRGWLQGSRHPPRVGRSCGACEGNAQGPTATWRALAPLCLAAASDLLLLTIISIDHRGCSCACGMHTCVCVHKKDGECVMRLRSVEVCCGPGTSLALHSKRSQEESMHREELIKILKTVLLQWTRHSPRLDKPGSLSRTAGAAIKAPLYQAQRKPAMPGHGRLRTCCRMTCSSTITLPRDSFIRDRLARWFIRVCQGQLTRWSIRDSSGTANMLPRDLFIRKLCDAALKWRRLCRGHTQLPSSRVCRGKEGTQSANTAE